MLIGAGCGPEEWEAGVEERGAEELIFENRLDPGPDFDNDLNVYESNELEWAAHNQGPFELGKTNFDHVRRVQLSAGLSRTAIHHINYKPSETEENGTFSCSYKTHSSSGQMVGYNAALTAHHSALYDDEDDRSSVAMRSIVDGVWKGSGGTEKPDSRHMRQRLYSLGLTELANPNTTKTDPFHPALRDYMTQWEFYITEDGYEGSRSDFVVEVSKPKCLQKGSRFEFPIYGPGIFTDWMQVEESEYSDHVNHEPSANGFMQLFDGGPPPTDWFHSLALLPGVVGAQKSSSDSEEGCLNSASSQDPWDDYFIISDYADVVTTSLDITNGISGSGVWHEGEAAPPVWGLLTSSAPDGEWDRAAGADVNSDEPQANEWSGVSIFYQAAVDEVQEQNEGRKRPNGSSEPSRGDQPGYDIPGESPALPVPPQKDEPKPDGCVGNCSGEIELERVCSDFYQEHFPEWGELNEAESHEYVASGIGVWGGAAHVGETKVLSDFGLVCGPWSSYPYSMFWHYVFRTGADVEGDVYDTRSIHKSSESGAGGAWPRWLSLDQPTTTTQYQEPHHERLEQMPFQNCPAGYVLSGVRFEKAAGDNHLLGVHEIECRRIYDPIIGREVEVIPLIPDFYGDLNEANGNEYLRFFNEIGDVQSSNNLQWMRCPDEENEHITGMTLYYDNMTGPNPLKGVFPHCTTNPEPLEEGKQVCDTEVSVDGRFHTEISSPYGAPQWPKAPNPSCATPGTAACP